MSGRPVGATPPARQFEVYPNPVPAARRAYPYVVVLQADAAASLPTRMVAPLVPADRCMPTSGRLLPPASLAEGSFLVAMPSLTAVPARDLRESIADLGADRERLMVALDALFYGA